MRQHHNIFTARITEYGGPGDDKLTGGPGNDDLRGYGGDDYLDGGAGNDRLAGMAGTDILRGGEGADTMYGGTGDDNMRGGAGDDLMYGGPGDDYMNGGGQRELIRGGPGNDEIHAGDYVRGAGGNTAVAATYTAGLYGGPGDDLIYGSDRGHIISGGPGNDTIYAGSSIDEIDGGPGVDEIHGGGGVDEIKSDGDFLWGGRYGDTFDLRGMPEGREAWIMDFFGNGEGEGGGGPGQDSVRLPHGEYQLVEYENGLKYVGEGRVIYFEGVDDRELIQDNTYIDHGDDLPFYAEAFQGTPERDVWDVTHTPPGARLYFLDFGSFVWTDPVSGDRYIRGDRVEINRGWLGRGEISRADGPSTLGQSDLDWLRENDFIGDDETLTGWEFELEGRHVFLEGVTGRYQVGGGGSFNSGIASLYNRGEQWLMAAGADEIAPDPVLPIDPLDFAAEGATLEMLT